MSKICELCAKRPRSGMNVSHSNRHTKRRFLPNIITRKFGHVKKKICTACLRTLSKPPRIKKESATQKSSSVV